MSVWKRRLRNTLICMVQYILPYVRLILSLILVLFQTKVPFCTFNRSLKYKLHTQYTKHQWYITTEFAKNGDVYHVYLHQHIIYTIENMLYTLTWKLWLSERHDYSKFTDKWDKTVPLNVHPVHLNRKIMSHSQHLT